MGKEKFDMSAKFILKEDFFSDAINKLETIFSNNASDDSMLERLFDQLKNPTPIALKNGRDCVYVIDFLVYNFKARRNKSFIRKFCL